MAIIVGSINLSLIDNAHVFPGKKGDYLDVVLLENRDGPDQYGNLYMIVQGVSKEARAAGERGVILGNAKVLESSQRPAPQRTQRTYGRGETRQDRGGGMDQTRTTQRRREAPPARYGREPEPQQDELPPEAYEQGGEDPEERF